LKETEKLKAISDAEREKAVKAIHIKQKIEVSTDLCTFGPFTIKLFANIIYGF
jgi:hypothetical protein